MNHRGLIGLVEFPLQSNYPIQVWTWRSEVGFKTWLFVLMGFVVSCASQPSDHGPEKAPLVEEKYRLTADRSAFEELRAQVPADKIIENDEAALTKQWMSDFQFSPQAVRDKFSNVVSKRRAEFQKDMDRKRESFVHKERLDRDQFSKQQDQQRAEFRSKKSTSEQNKAFYEDIEKKRKDFYEGQREQRDQFEADMRDQRKNFDDYIHEKQSAFNDDVRDYSKRYEEHLKELELAKQKREEERVRQQVHPLSTEE